MDRSASPSRGPLTPSTGSPSSLATAGELGRFVSPKAEFVGSASPEAGSTSPKVGSRGGWTTYTMRPLARDRAPSQAAATTRHLLLLLLHATERVEPPCAAVVGRWAARPTHG